MGPPCQCRVASLLYRIGEVRDEVTVGPLAPRRVPEDWHMVPGELLSKTIRDCLPEGQRDGWKELQ
eukprot:8414297-Lingulodinium_polyedra.AAC.1